MIQGIVARLQGIGLGLVVSVLLLNLLVIVGWSWDIRILRSGLPNSVSMNPMTSVLCITSSVSLLLFQSHRIVYRKAGQILASVILLAGIIRIGEIFYGFPSNLSNVFFIEKSLRDGPAGSPNVIATNTAFCILSTSLSLMIYPMRFKRFVYSADWLAIFSCLLAFGSLIGYLYHDTVMYSPFGALPMAFSTAIAFFFLSAAILCLRCQAGIFRIFTKRHAGSRMARYLVPIALLLPIILGLLLRYGQLHYLLPSSFSITLVLTINVVVMLFMILHGARQLNHSSLALETERKRSELLNTRLLKEEAQVLKQKLLETEISQQRQLMKATIEAQEQEKKEIGMELHDHVNQVLASTKLYLEVAKSNSSLTVEMIDKCRNQLSYVIDEIRNLSRNLVLHDIGQDSIGDKIADMTRYIGQSSGMKMDLRIDENVLSVMNYEQRVNVFRIIQEQLQNVLKHAHATQVVIEVVKDSKIIKLKIIDNGVGFSLKGKPKGIGLKNIASRTASIDGEIRIISAPGKGCELLVSFPLISEQPSATH